MDLKIHNRVMLFPRLNKILIVVVSLAFIVAGLRAYQLFTWVFEDNVRQTGSMIIPYEASFEQVLDSLRTKDLLKNEKAFIWVCRKKDYPAHIKPGRYVFEKGQITNAMVNMLKAGNQQAVTVTFNNLRYMEELAGKVARYLATDSLSLLNWLNDSVMIREMGFDFHSFHAMFIPNSYKMYWTTSPEQFTKRMKAEYERFWNRERKAKADSIGLSRVEVIILASIVQEETVREEEKPVVAGLYLNRIRENMLLQADPTIKYALGDFSLRRILTRQLETDSPYNTYKYAGLPPGPINFPEISSIEAILNARQHNYLYMCAREDFSGYHNFARTLREHNRNARLYQQALNARKIWE
ncbi:MAG: endolytic transglycosylase MltG [Mangrovibacterium sp.]